jgi:hypothetical protein
MVMLGLGGGVRSLGRLRLILRSRRRGALCLRRHRVVLRGRRGRALALRHCWQRESQRKRCSGQKCPKFLNCHRASPFLNGMNTAQVQTIGMPLGLGLMSAAAVSGIEVIAIPGKLNRIRVIRGRDSPASPEDYMTRKRRVRRPSNILDAIVLASASSHTVNLSGAARNIA